MMSTDDPSSAEQTPPAPMPEEIPVIEDVNSANSPIPQSVPQDDPESLASVSRSPDEENRESTANEDPAQQPLSDAPQPAVTLDETTDAETISDEAPAKGDVEQPTAQRPESHERSAHRVTVELKRVEAEVRQLLDHWDYRRKRKLSGTRCWLDLEEDLIQWRHAGRIDQDSLNRLQSLIVRRHHLFHQLSYFATTRPRWNS